MTMRSALVRAGVAILAVVAVVLTTLVVSRELTSRDANPAESMSGPYRVSVIGDSFSSGLGAAVNWPTLFAQGSEFAVTNVAVAGAGYVGGKGESSSFSDQIGNALAAKPNLVVVFGGINDVGKPSDLVGQMASDLFTQITQLAPDARLLVLGPIWHTDPPPAVGIELSKSIQAPANALNIPFMSLIDERWLVGDGKVQADGVHPTDAGQRALAVHLGPIIRQAARAEANR